MKLEIREQTNFQFPFLKLQTLKYKSVTKILTDEAIYNTFFTIFLIFGIYFL